MKIKKIKHKNKKFFGYPEDSYARLGGKNGKKRSYGHYSGYSDGRTRQELKNKIEREENNES